MPHARAHDGTRVHYRIEGTAGPAVVLIQGLGLSSAFWGDVPNSLQEPSDPHRVVLIDNRGVGQTDRPRRPFRVEDMADDVAVVLDHAGIESAFVAGISMGGMIAQQVALRHPNRVLGLLLMSTTPGLPVALLPPVKSLGVLARVPFASIPDGRRRIFERLFFSSHPPEERARRASAMMLRWRPLLEAEKRSPLSFFAQLFAAARHSTASRLNAITCPTHVATGADDVLIPPRNSELIASRIPGATLEFVPKAGHALPADDPDLVRRSIVRLRAARRASEAA